MSLRDPVEDEMKHMLGGATIHDLRLLEMNNLCDWKGCGIRLNANQLPILYAKAGARKNADFGYSNYKRE